jgi:alkylation response protein AidB-like acyl-CoA dehydrogenase
MLVHETAWMLDEGLPCDMEVSMTKAQANEAIQDALWRAHQVLAGVGFCTQDGFLPLVTKRSLPAYHYLGDSDYHLARIAKHVEQWPPPEKPQGKPLGIFDTPEDLQVPAWDVWRNQTKGKLW